MCNIKILSLLFLTFIGIFSVHAQKKHTEICVDFRVGSMHIDSKFSHNNERISEIISFIESIRKDTTSVLVEVSFCGAASPEGSHQLNKKLAHGRVVALEKLIRQSVNIPDSIITHDEHYIPWDYLIEELKTSDLHHKDEAIAILKEEARLIDYEGKAHIDQRVMKLQQLDGGKFWKQLNQRYFKQMRNACAVFITYKKEVSLPLPEPKPVLIQPEPVVIQTTDSVIEPVIAPDPIVKAKADTLIMPASILPKADDWTRHIHLKSNAIGWGMLIANIAVEVDVAKHWSVTIPYYYSALNYFTSTRKFRTSCLQPEVRYWLSEENEGWFGGVHLGLAWFNYAKGGAWRYQDHNGNSPLFGGGISGGYRMPISKSQKWWMEFSLGTGVYRLHYDIFHNEPNGKKVDTVKRAFFGIDNVAVSVAYRLDWKKKGGKR